MNVYKKRRIESGLSVYTVAREMGFSKKQWQKVEKGYVNLDKQWLDKFNDVIARAKELKFNRITKLAIAKEAIKSGELKEKMLKQNLSLAGISRALGYVPSTGSYAFMLKNTSDDVIEEFYDYIMNPVNKKVPTIKKDKKETPKEQPIQEARLVDPEEEQCEEHVETNVEEHVETQSGTQSGTQTIPSSTNLEQRVAMLEREKEILLMQIIRYEKLIDRI